MGMACGKWQRSKICRRNAPTPQKTSRPPSASTARYRATSLASMALVTLSTRTKSSASLRRPSPRTSASRRSPTASIASGSRTVRWVKRTTVTSPCWVASRRTPVCWSDIARSCCCGALAIIADRGRPGEEAPPGQGVNCAVFAYARGGRGWAVELTSPTADEAPADLVLQRLQVGDLPGLRQRKALSAQLPSPGHPEEAASVLNALRDASPHGERRI